MSLRVLRFLALTALLSIPASADLIYSVGALEKTATPSCTYPTSASDPYCISSNTTLFLSTLVSIDQFGGYQDWNFMVAANTFTILWQAPDDDPEVVDMEGTATIRVYGRSGDDTGFFNAEILDLEMLGTAHGPVGDYNASFSGNPGSNGYLSVTDIGGGTLDVQSYFSLSFDFAFNDPGFDDPAHAGSVAGFASALAPDPPAVPEPSTFLLVAGAGVAAIAIRRRK